MLQFLHTLHLSLSINLIPFLPKHYHISREKFEPEPGLELGPPDSSMAERQARDLEVRVRVPVQVQIFLLKSDDVNVQRQNKYNFVFNQ